MKKINLGCGNIYREGWVNCDISRKVKADRYFDVRGGLPFLENSAGEVHCGCLLEQICSNEDFVRLMNEIWRVLSPDGRLTGYVPNANYPCAFQDPMDCRHFNEDTFHYFEEGHNYYKEFGDHYNFKPWRDIHYATNESGILHFSMRPAK